MNEATVESMIKLKKLTGKRLTPESIDQTIKSTAYYVFPNTTTTVCCLILTNNFTVIGESACASIENFDKELGEQIAFTNAREKIWQLEGYLLRQQIYEEQQ